MVLGGDHLIGDLLMQTPAIRAYKKLHPEEEITFVYEGNPSWELLQENKNIDYLISKKDYKGPEPRVLNCSWAFQYGVQHQCTMIEGHCAELGVPADDLRYELPLTNVESNAAYIYCQQKKNPVIIARHSHSCTSNDPAIKFPNKCLPNKVWVDLANWLIKNDFTPIAVGGPKDAIDPLYEEWPGEKLYGAPLRTVAAILKHADLTISVDTGIRHMAGAVGGRLLTLSGATPTWLVKCVPQDGTHQIIEQKINIHTITADNIIKMLGHF